MMVTKCTAQTEGGRWRKRNDPGRSFAILVCCFVHEEQAKPEGTCICGTR
jgi:hypothetical protein